MEDDLQSSTDEERHVGRSLFCPGTESSVDNNSKNKQINEH